MSFQVDSISIKKEGMNNGTASVKLMDENDNFIFLNGFVIDLNDGIGPVSVLRTCGSPVYNGSIVEDLCMIILEVWEESLSNSDPGLYLITKDKVEQLK